MKKALFFLPFLFLFSDLSADQIVPRLKYDLAGIQNFSKEGRTIKGEADPGISLGVEYLHQSSEFTEIGMGFEYQIPRKLSKLGAFSFQGKFNFISLYGLLRYYLANNPQEVRPYLKLNLGYNIIYDGDVNYMPKALKGGVCWALGAGADVTPDISFEILYQVYNGTYELAEGTFDTVYSAVGLAAGYRFNL